MRLPSRFLLPLLALAAILAPVPAAALGPPETLSRTLPVGAIGGIAPPRTAPFPLDFLGISWASGEEPQVRFRVGGRWGPWTQVHEEEAGGGGERTYGRLVPAGDAEAFQVRGANRGVLAHALNTTDGPRSVEWRVPAAEATHLPQGSVVSRAAWGADESYRFSGGTEKGPQAFFPVQKLIVHHTVTSNADPDPAATVRGIYAYHTNTRGFADIAYHFLIDASGVVYKGRYSGPVGTTTADSVTGEDPAGNAVRGAHTGGYNSGTVGIALLGDFTSLPPSAAARSALVSLLAWEADHHGLDPLTADTYTNPETAAAKTVEDVSGHRDWSSTACPGEMLYPDMPAIRSEVAARLHGTFAVRGDAERTFQSRRAFTVAWDPGASSYDVYVRTGRNGTFEAPAPILIDSPATSLDFTATTGATHCFSVAATDATGAQGPPGPERCTAVPLDERKLKRRGAWSGGRAGGSYLKTYLESDDLGARLSTKVRGARRIAVVVTRCRGCGTLEVLFKKKRLRRIGLGGAPKRGRVVEVASFAQPRSGFLVLRVASSGRRVRVEGLGVALA